MQAGDASSMAVVQHERFVLWVLVRYLPFLIGASIALLFGMSVLHDNHDLANCSWAGGGDFLGVYGDLARGLLGPLFAASALFRRGLRRIVRIERVDDEGLRGMDESGKAFVIPKASVRSVFRYAVGDGTDAIVLELSAGVLRFGMPGDRVTLTVDPRTARDIEEKLRTSETVPVSVATRSLRTGGVIAAASLVFGTLVGVLLYKWISHVAGSLPRASYYLPVSPDAHRGWVGGLTISSMGVVHAAISLAVRPTPLTLDTNCLHVGGLLRLTIRYADIADVQVRGRTLQILLDDDTLVSRRFWTVDPRKLEGLAAELRKRVGLEHAEETPVPSGLERGEQPVREWGQMLAARAKLSRYRAGALDPVALESCVRSRIAPREAKVGAAIALANALEPTDRQKLRALATDLPQPSLRALVEELAEGEAEEASIVAALARR